MKTLLRIFYNCSSFRMNSHLMRMFLNVWRKKLRSRTSVGAKDTLCRKVWKTWVYGCYRNCFE